MFSMKAKVKIGDVEFLFTGENYPDAVEMVQAFLENLKKEIEKVLDDDH